MDNYCPNQCSLIEIWIDLGLLTYHPVFDANNNVIDEYFKVYLKGGRNSYIQCCPSCGKRLYKNG